MVVYARDMRLTRVEVHGYKNASAPLCLEDLAPVNVIHGENNVGKSNLLEAIELFFELVAKPSNYKGLGDMAIPFPKPWNFEVDRWNQENPQFPSRFMFNLRAYQPIKLSMRFAVDADEWRAAGMVERTSFECRAIDMSMSVKRVTNRILAGIESVSLDDQRLHPDAGQAALYYLMRFLTANDRAQPIESRFARIVAYRELYPALEASDYALALYDAKESFDPLHYRRWELFASLMSRFDDVLGSGQFVPVYHRHQNRAFLTFQTPHARMPMDLLGTGVQQLVQTVALLLMSNATIVAIEEPELSLRHSLQLRLRDLFQEIVESDAGPSQIFITSHSPAFETGAFFYHLEPGPDGPTVTRRPVADAAMATAHTLDGLEVRGRAPLSYVTSDGLVRLPDPVRAQLGVERGGGIVVYKRPEHPYVELMTDQQFLDDGGLGTPERVSDESS